MNRRSVSSPEKVPGSSYRLPSSSAREPRTPTSAKDGSGRTASRMRRSPGLPSGTGSRIESPISRSTETASSRAAVISFAVVSRRRVT
ncbi:hypothetical protein ACIBCM_11530 [Streptomyces sp. NPDC051018]|uniref:hypothetical protein n=1 Tax=Streptomyces sp. NPDC051018 TaxID=3365639 RepID=UPI00378842D9